MTGLLSFQFLLSNQTLVTFYAASETVAREYALTWARSRGLTVTAGGVETGTVYTETNR